MSDENLVILDHRRPERPSLDVVVMEFLCMAIMAAQKVGASDLEIATMMTQIGTVNLDSDGPCDCEGMRYREVPVGEIRKALHEAFAYTQERFSGYTAR